MSKTGSLITEKFEFCWKAKIQYLYLYVPNISKSILKKSLIIIFRNFIIRKILPRFYEDLPLLENNGLILTQALKKWGY